MNMRKIYREIAKKEGKTIKEIKFEMQNAINIAYLTSEKEEKIKKCQEQIVSKKEIPNVEEVIQYVRNRIL